MPVTAALVLGGSSLLGSLGSSALGFFGSQSASKAQVQAQQDALQQQAKLFGVLQGAAQPLINTGNNVLGTGQGIIDSGLGYAKSAASTLSGLLTPGPNQTSTLSQIPGFTFAQDWGQKAVQNLGTTMGLGGNTLKAGADYATGAAQQGFGNIATLLQGLLSGGTSMAGVGTNLAGIGGNLASSGVGALSGGATSFSNQSSNTFGNIGTAQASGVLGGANAVAGGLQGGTNAISNSYLLSKLLSGGGGTLGSGGVGLDPGGSSGIYSAATGSRY